MPTSRSVQTKLDELFQTPLAEFTRTRDALVAAQRKAGKSGPAAALKAIKKPSVSAWTVNQLFYREPELWAKLQAAGSALRRAYGSMAQGGAGDTVRKAQKELGRTQDLLRVKARAILQSSRQKASAGMLGRIGTTLHALAVGEPDGAVQAGQLVADVDPPGFEAFASALGAPPPKGKTAPVSQSPGKFAKAPAPPPHRPVKDQPAPSRSPGKRLVLKTTPPIQKKPELARAARQERERLAKQRSAQAALRKAQRELATCTRALAAATRKMAAAERALTRAEAAREKARHAQKAAQQAVEKAQSGFAES